MKKSLLEICNVLRLFLNTITADDKYSLLNRDNLTQLIQMQLSQKKKAFTQFFALVCKSKLNFEHLRKKDHRHSKCFSEIADSQRRG